MAINGNDLPSSLADKHALEAATSVSELLTLNKLGSMYTPWVARTSNLSAQSLVLPNPVGIMGTLGSSLKSGWWDERDPGKHPPLQTLTTVAAGVVPLLPAEQGQRSGTGVLLSWAARLLSQPAKL